MTYDEGVNKFLDKVDEIQREDPAYKQPGDGSGGVCDCIGLPIGAGRRAGFKYTGIHGSNFAARNRIVDLHYIDTTDRLKRGDVVLKACDSTGKVRLACNKGSKTHKYDLPDRYKRGNPYYNGDLLDYYHAGVVDSVNPLRIKHMTSPRMKVDTNLNGGWNYTGKWRPVYDECDGKPAPEPKPIPTPVPSTGSKAIVVADNGAPVKVRQYPSTSCRTWDRVPCGTKVEIIDPGEDWAQINCGKRKGWYMMAKFLDVIGDGKGKY